VTRLAEDWLTWLIQNLLRDEPRGALEAVLVEQGLTPEQAAEELDGVLQSPIFAAARRAVRPAYLTARLRQAHLRLADREIPRRAGLCSGDFLNQCIVGQIPVVLPDLTEGWPAREWTWDALRAAHGHQVVAACVGRSEAAHPTLEWKRLTREMPFSELVERLTDPRTGNDIYVIANNAALEGPLAGLLDDVRPVPGILPASRLRETSTWIGGAGAHTPLHHDTSDILFCPFLGRKRVRLVPPEELEVTLNAEGYWAPEVDFDDPELAVRETVVEPGEALLIPSGWWHAVDSLEPSLTLTFAGLGHRNSFAWYKPGATS
jgi:hypothetical protein